MSRLDKIEELIAQRDALNKEIEELLNSEWTVTHGKVSIVQSHRPNQPQTYSIRVTHRGGWKYVACEKSVKDVIKTGESLAKDLIEALKEVYAIAQGE